MPSRHERLDELARRVAAGERLTLLCSSACRDARRCHRTVLAEAIARRTPVATLQEKSAKTAHTALNGSD